MATLSIHHQSSLTREKEKQSSALQLWQAGCRHQPTTPIFFKSRLRSELVGCPLLLGLVYYEKYGHDPQKRSLYNQLLSGLWVALLLCTSVHFFIILLRMIFGILPLAFGLCVMLCVVLGFTTLFLTTIEISIYQILRKVKYHSIAMKDDYFFFAFLTAFNCMFGFLTFGAARLLDESTPEIFYISYEEERQPLTTFTGYV